MKAIYTRVVLPATAHGWMRLSDLDTDTRDAWEMPCGCIHAAPKGEMPRIVTVHQEASKP